MVPKLNGLRQDTFYFDLPSFGTHFRMKEQAQPQELNVLLSGTIIGSASGIIFQLLLSFGRNGANGISRRLLSRYHKAWLIFWRGKRCRGAQWPCKVPMRAHPCFPTVQPWFGQPFHLQASDCKTSFKFQNQRAQPALQPRALDGGLDTGYIFKLHAGFDHRTGFPTPRLISLRPTPSILAC